MIEDGLPTCVRAIWYKVCISPGMAIRNHSIAISSAGFCRVDREGRVGKSLSPWTYRIWMGDRCLGGPGALRRTERLTPIRTAHWQDYGRCPCSEYEIPFTIRRCMTRASTSAASINAINHIHIGIEAILITLSSMDSARVGRTSKETKHTPLFLQLTRRRNPDRAGPRYLRITPASYY